MNAFAHLTPDMRALVREMLLPPEPVFTPEELSRFGTWVAATGMRPEGAREFDLKKYPYQVELYDEQRDDYRARVAIMKAAQTGLTIKLLNRAMWWTGDVRRQINVGLGFPTKSAVEQLAASRFRPQLYTSPRMIQLLRKNSINRVDLVRLGISNMRFLGLVSGVTADSNPLDVELLDEVRLVPERTVERFMVRTSESTLFDHKTSSRGIIELNSTAGFPKKDIHRYFMDSTMGWWAVRCPDVKCLKHLTGIILPQEFAQRVGRVVGQRPDGTYYLRCPRCGAHLHDGAIGTGFYLHENPGAQWTGYQFSQLIKGEAFLNSEIMPAWNRGLNIPEFYNSRLGLPYMDAEAVPAPRDVIERCCDLSGDYHWPANPEGRRDGRWRALGIDQRAPEKHYVIKSLGEGNLERHEAVGVIEASGEPAARAIVQLARDWAVNIVIIDGEPSYDLAVMVATALPKGMVYFADYSPGSDIVTFVDKHTDKSMRKSSGEVKYPYRALIDRYKAIDWELGKFPRQQILLPARSNLYAGATQKRTTAGLTHWVSAMDEYVDHLSGMARYKAQKTEKINGETIYVPGEYILKWRSMEVEDPHYLHASLYAGVGLHYRKMMGSISTGTEPAAPAQAGAMGLPVPPQLPGGELAHRVAAELQQGREAQCGNCAYRAVRGGRPICGHPVQNGHEVGVRDQDPGCDLHERAAEAEL